MLALALTVLAAVVNVQVELDPPVAPSGRTLTGSISFEEDGEPEPMRGWSARSAAGTVRARVPGVESFETVVFGAPIEGLLRGSHRVAFRIEFDPALSPEQLARALFEAESRAWKIPQDRFTPAPLVIDIAPHSTTAGPRYDGTFEWARDDLEPFFHSMCVGDALTIFNPRGDGTCNAHAVDFNVGIPERGAATVRPKGPGLQRVYCDVHHATLGWLLVTER